MRKVLSLLLSMSFLLNANALIVEETLGRGGVSMAIGDTSNAFFLNPANIPLSSDNKLHANIMNKSIALSLDSMKFIQELSLASLGDSNEKNQDISQLLSNNIGKSLHFSSNNFSSIYRNEENYSWLIGILDALDANFITHTGFGSLGALESQVDEYYALVATVVHQEDNFKYALTLKAINRYQIAHNYSILEMMEADSILDYFDNEYKKNKFAIALDAGVTYAFKNNPYNIKVAMSMLNIGNTDFDELGQFNETTNIGVSMRPFKQTVVGIDYMDVFHESNALYKEDNLRFGISHDFLGKSLQLSSGMYNGRLTLGINYQASVVKISLNTYEIKSYNNQKSREYQFFLAINW